MENHILYNGSLSIKQREDFIQNAALHGPDDYVSLLTYEHGLTPSRQGFFELDRKSSEITLVVSVRTNAILIVILLAFCSGCGTVLTGFDRNPYPVYGGVRQDAHVIGGGGGGVILIIDVPFSFAADTLLLPLGLYDLTLLPPSVDPLKGWNSWNPWDEEPQPAGIYDRTTRSWSKTLPPKHSPLDKAIKDDYQNYLKKHEPGYVESGTSFHEDATGQHAVRVQIGRNGYYRIYIFRYDKNNLRMKIIRYANGGYAC